MKCLPTTILLTALLAHAPSGTPKQRFTGRYYPEKQEYLVGEPIIADLEVINDSRKVGEISEGCEDMSPGPFELDGAARKKKATPFGCGPDAIAINCLVGVREIPAGGRYIKRLFLNGPFALDSPGTYRIRARSEQGIGRSGSKEVLANLRVESEFEVTLRAPHLGELEAAYKPFFDELKSKDASVRYFAASAITQNPPPFAEATISALAIDAITGTLRAEGLGRLGTPTARAKLIAMASTGPEEFRQPAIQALGELGNPDDCQTMLEIGNQNRDYTQGEAYMYAGRICKEKAVPALLRLTPNANAPLSGYLAVAFENTVSNSAVAPLIGLLANSDETVRRQAEKSLETLTHRKPQYGTATAESPDESRMEWTKWWANNGEAAPIYGSDQCTEPQPLPRW